jgi:hypothetical protein
MTHFVLCGGQATLNDRVGILAACDQAVPERRERGREDEDPDGVGEKAPDLLRTLSVDL